MHALCEETEADVDEVARAIGTDSRIGPKFLKSSAGFGGSCFQKDILNLLTSAGISVSRGGILLGSGGTHERIPKERFVSRILDNMFNTVSGKASQSWVMLSRRHQ